MTEKIKVWHQGEWTCCLMDNGVSQSTVSLTRLEAAALRQKLIPPEKIANAGVNGDAGEGERLYGLKAGYILTEEDARDIENQARDLNDLIEDQAMAFDEGRLDAFREMGGDELVALVTARRDVEINRTIEKTMAKFKAKLESQT